LIEKLTQTNLSFDIGESTLQQAISLECLYLVQEEDEIILQESVLAKVKSNWHYLEKATIYQENLLFPGVKVYKKDKRFGWKGILLDQTEEGVIVDWGAGTSPRLHDINEISICQDTKISIFEVALRGRSAISTKQIAGSSNTTKTIVKKELSFKIGDLVKLVDSYHYRANDTGLIESYNDGGQCIVRWQSDNDRQIAISSRTFYTEELTLISQASFL
jgi:hypothetical protein